MGNLSVKFVRSSDLDAEVMYREALGKSVLLTADEEVTYIKRAQSGDIEARNIMIEANIRLVAGIAEKYKNRGVPYLDLVQEGNLGLFKAIEKFELDRGVRFYTYAKWRVRKKIERSIDNNARNVRIAVPAIEGMNKYYKALDLWHVDNDSLPEDSDIAAILDWPLGKVNKVRNLTKVQYSQSTDVVVPSVYNNENGKKLFIDTLEDGVDDGYLTFFNDDLEHKVQDYLDCLKPKQREAVSLFFGLGDYDEHTYKEISNILGIPEYTGAYNVVALARKNLKREIAHNGFEWPDFALDDDNVDVYAL